MTNISSQVLEFEISQKCINWNDSFRFLEPFGTHTSNITFKTVYNWCNAVYTVYFFEAMEFAWVEI